MSDTGRLTVLLEQYRDRLRNRGEESHDDEILYILQVLESPLMREFLTDNIPGGGAALLQQVASAFEDQESDVHLSPQSKRKRQLARQASLRALKIALTPRSSPSNSPKVSKASENRQQGIGYPLTQNMTANRYRKRGGSHKSTPSPTGSRDGNDMPHPVSYHQPPPMTSLEISKSPDQVVPQEKPYNLDHIYINPYTGKPESSIAMATSGMATSTSPTDTDEYDSTHQHVLSNSTNTLIERTVTPADSRVKKYSTGSDSYSDFVKKGLNSEDIRTPEMGESQEDNFMQMLDFNEHSIAPSLVPVSHRKDQPHPLPALPSYTEALSSQQRVKSFEDLLNNKPTQSIHMGPSIRQPQTQQQSPSALPPYYSFRSTPSGGATRSQNPPVPQNGASNPPPSRGRFVTLSLLKGPHGLGFSINKKKNTKKGELSVYVQDVQVGSVADAEGIRKGDYLVSINKQKVSGIGVPTIVSLLQQVKGKVEIVLFRKDGGVSHEGSPSPVFLPPEMPHPPTVPHPPMQSKQLNSPKLSKAPHSFPVLSQLNHRVTPSPPLGPAPPPSGPAPPPLVPIPPPLQFMPASSLISRSSPPDSPVAPPTLFTTTKVTSSPVSINSMTPPPPISMTQPPHIPAMTIPSSITTSKPSHSLMGPVVSNSSSYSATPPPPPPQAQEKSRLSSSNVTELISINLINQGHNLGFGFSLVTEPNGGSTFIKSIVPNGLAHKDGRLCPNDRIIVINGTSIEGLSHEAVTSILKEINRQGLNLVIVVARVKQDTHNSDNEEDLVSDTDSSSDYEDHEVELVKPVGQGLGIGINALVNDEKGVDRGIYIKSVNPNGPAGLCGNVFVKDRIIKVNEHSLKSLSNMEAANHLRSSGQVVKLVLRRHKPVRRRFKVTVVKREQQSSEGSPSPTVTGPAPSMTGPTHFKYNQTGQDEGDGEGAEFIRGPVPLEIGDSALLPLDFSGYEVEDDEMIKRRWKGRIPHDRAIKISRISRAHSNTSLGFTMESVFVRDDIGQSHDGDVCHVIQSILPGGLIDQDSVLMVDDELLEVNGIPLVGMTHDQATHLVQSIAGDVTIVVCRPREDGIDDMPHSLIDGAYDGEIPVNNATNTLTTTSESEDDHHSNSGTLTSSSSPALHSIYLTSAIPDFSRRFERQSWRERQAELTKKLKERFETKRWQYYRNLQERIEELEKVDHELEARTQRRKENEEKQEPEGNEEEKGMPLHSTAFDYSYPSSMGYYSAAPIEEHVDVGEEPLANKRDSVASEESSAGVLSPVPGSGLWDSDIVEVELQRENEGLGFSILDFADPLNQGDRVILVHSLVPGGTAEKDGRIQRGDKLSSVNGVSVVNHTLEFTVEQLKSTAEDGLVHICINHPIPDTPDINSTPSSFSRDSIAEEEEDNEQEDEQEEEEEGEGHPMGVVNDGEDDIVSVTDNEEKAVRSKQQQESKTTETATNDQTQSDRHGNERHHDNPTNWQGKRSFNEEEPPPPYTEVDPLETGKQGGAVRRISSQDNNGRSLTPGMLPGGGTGPTQPHPMFNRTRSDEPAIARGHYGHLNDFHGTVRMMESTSEETLVASVSNQDLHVASGSQPSPKQHSSPHMSGRNFVTNSNALTSQDSNQGLSQVPTASPRSQDDSAQERVSPDTSDTGDHSAETEAEPRSVEIVKGPNPLGMSLMEDKGLVYVKKIESTSVLGRDGRIRAGDRILSINGKSLEGMAFSKVKSILKRASSNRSTRIKIKYIPASLPTSTSVGMGEPSNQTDHPHYAQSHAVPSHQPYPMRQVIPPHPMATPLQNPLNPGLIPPSAQATNYPHWMQQGQHMGYNPTGPSIPTRPQVNLHTSYIEHPVPIKPPPPPYQLYQGTVGHQPYNTHLNYIPGMEYQTPGAPGGWNVGLQNPIQYGGRGEFMGNNQYQGSMTTATNQQMSAPPTHLMTHPPHQPAPYQQQQHESYRYMQYKQEEVGGAGMRSGNGNYDMKQNRNVASDWQQQGNQQIENYSSRKNPGNNGSHLEPVGPPRVIEVKRDNVGSLGISLGLPEGGREGVVIIDLSHACSAINKGKLLVGDRILEVNGHNLRHATQSEAVNIIKHSNGPVKMLVQSYTGGGANGRRRPQYSPLHSNDGSWAIDEEEDESLRQLFPNAGGYLFEVTLNKGNGALGLSIWKTRETQSVVVMQVQPGGLADQTARIRRGDEILQVNDRCVIGWRHEEVSRLLKQSPPLVKMILVRPLPFPMNSAQSNHPTSTAGVQNLRQKLHVLQEKQQQQQQQFQLQQGEEPTADDTSNSTTVTKQQQQPAAATKPVPPEKEVEEDNGNSINSLLVNSGLPLVKAISIDRDDDIGLGFTVSEIESQGEPRVVVNSIVPNGPADKEGQLNVGDNIISIDGHKVIGAKYEKATHLLQQARSRGTVDLIVSSQTKLPVKLTDKIEPAPHKRKNMGEKRKRVRSEGVTLRNKITKKPQIRSKRRPVSVDCEINYDLSGILRIDSQSSGKGEGSSSGSHSNRNSRVLNETEVRQGGGNLVSTALDHNDIKPGKLSTIEIFRGKDPLGVSITGGVGSHQEGVFIHKIHPGTPAAFDDRLKPGDRIIKVGHTPVDTATKDDVIKMIVETQSVVQFTVYRAPILTPDTPSGAAGTGTPSVPPPTGINSTDHIETVEVIKPEQRGIGLMIVEDNTNGVIVSDVVDGEAAAFTARIHKGDKILAINGEDITTAGRDVAISLLSNCRGKVSLKVQHLGEDALRRAVSVDNTLEEYSPSHYQRNNTSPSKGVPRKLPNYHSPSPPTNGALPRLQEHPHQPPSTDQPTPLRDSRGTTPLRSDHSYDDDAPSLVMPHQQYRSTNRYRDVVGQNIPDSAHIPQGHEVNQLQRRNARVVHLRRGPTGLGFSIVGGKGSSNGDLPICVRTVSRESVAGKEGMLQPGDIIIAVNGVSFDNCTHQTAVETLKRCGDSIMLTICSP